MMRNIPLYLAALGATVALGFLYFGLGHEQPFYDIGVSKYQAGFTIALGLSFLCVLVWRYINRPWAFRVTAYDLVKQFTNFNLFLFLAGLAGFFYPFFEILQNIGYLPLFLALILLNMVCAPLIKHGRELSAITAFMAFFSVILLLDETGDSSTVILPVEFPQAQKSEFTPEGLVTILKYETSKLTNSIRESGSEDELVSRLSKVYILSITKPFAPKTNVLHWVLPRFSGHL